MQGSRWHCPGSYCRSLRWTPTSTVRNFRRRRPGDALGEFLNARVEDSDLVIQLAVDPAFGYYYKGAARDIGLPLKPNQPAAEITATLSDLSGEYDSVFVVAREQAGWENRGVVVDWFQSNMQEVLHANASGLPVRQYKHWTVADTYTDELARFNETVALLGFDSCEDRLPGGALLLSVYWRPLSNSSLDLKSFVHVYGSGAGTAANKLWAQDDQYPQEGRLAATAWQQAGAFRDIYYLPTASLSDGMIRGPHRLV